MKLFVRCQQVADHGSEWIDGELGPLSRLLVRAHLKLCANCSAYVKQLEQTIETARAPEGPPLSASGRSAVLERFRNKE